MTQGMSPFTQSPRQSVHDRYIRTLALLAFAYGWIYFPIVSQHRGDFFFMLTNRETSVAHWNGQGFGYGPIFALYDLVLRPLPDLLAMRLTFVMNHLLLAITFLLLIQTYLPAPRTDREVSLALFAWVNFYPLVQTLRQNNVEVTELFFLSLAGFYLSRAHEGRAGAALGMAGATKFLPLMLLPYLLWRRRWRMVAMALVAFGATATLVAALKGFLPWNGFETLGTAASTGWANQHLNNQGLIAVALRAFSTFDLTKDSQTAAFPRVSDAEAAISVGLGLVAVAVLTVVAVLWRRVGLVARRSTHRPELTEQLLVLTVIILSLPFAHTHYFCLVVAGYIALIRPMLRQELPPTAARLAVLSFCILGLLAPMRLLDPLVLRLFPLSLVDLWKLWSLPSLGAILLALALVSLHRVQLESLTRGEARQARFAGSENAD
jgi:hypothetical protein